MAKKNQATFKQVQEATARLLASNNGRIPYNTWLEKLQAEIGDCDIAVRQVVAKKGVFFFLDGFNADGTPNLLVVSQLPTA